MREKTLVWTLLVILLAPSVLNVNIIGVSADTYPSIYIEPSSIVNSTLTVGENITVSIKTDYTGYDVWRYEFTLDFNPGVLEGVQAELANGDIITTAVSPYAIFAPGEFNNNTGKLLITSAYIYYIKNVVNWPVPVASGNGTLANVTFRVVGYGSSNITLGLKTTELMGFTDVQLGEDDKYYGWGEAYTIIDDTRPDIGHILHGYFSSARALTLDLFAFSKAYGSELGDSNWNSSCDFDRDNKVDVSDLFDLSKNYGGSI